ncbi:hydrolase [Companilactobacillus sp. RD055328]|uniref:hydrolase n=1 Tax=Companilactobacillus sp. RD055328 TaxID=2916634 RepID=UPI001FC7FD1F|nr:hydrolase [Companilactobacillus sp. RD055328]GKQ42527.1 hydrolase [Companilactobacillus sp. RD055328]
MIRQSDWQHDSQYMAIVADLLIKPEVCKLKDITQHINSNRLDHSIMVSYKSYVLGKKMHLDYKAMARAGLLHDLFYYDWRTTKFNEGSHAYVHPRIALDNAKKITKLSKKEADIIVKHMWGATVAPPKYIESAIVSFVDDQCAIVEASIPFFKTKYAKLKFKFSGVS